MACQHVKDMNTIIHLHNIFHARNRFSLRSYRMRWKPNFLWRLPVVQKENGNIYCRALNGIWKAKGSATMSQKQYSWPWSCASSKENIAGCILPACVARKRVNVFEPKSWRREGKVIERERNEERERETHTHRERHREKMTEESLWSPEKWDKFIIL
jgi:hypothetical protein